MTTEAQENREPRGRWDAEGTGQWYDQGRWSHVARRARDPRIVERLIAGRLALSGRARILDAPCGTGRLRGVLEPHGAYLGVDISPSMLESASSLGVSPGAGWLRGDVERLPFRSATFELVICCRLLHHLRERAALDRISRELVRVSSRWILASFWDAGTLESLRRRLPLARRPRHRIARRRRELVASFALAGARIESWHSVLPGLSQQVWFLARKLGDGQDHE